MLRYMLVVIIDPVTTSSLCVVNQGTMPGHRAIQRAPVSSVTNWPHRKRSLDPTAAGTNHVVGSRKDAKRDWSHTITRRFPRSVKIHLGNYMFLLFSLLNFFIRAGLAFNCLAQNQLVLVCLGDHQGVLRILQRGTWALAGWPYAWQRHSVSFRKWN